MVENFGKFWVLLLYLTRLTPITDWWHCGTLIYTWKIAWQYFNYLPNRNQIFLPIKFALGKVRTWNYKDQCPFFSSVFFSLLFSFLYPKVASVVFYKRDFRIWRRFRIITAYFLRYNHLRHMKCLLTNIQKQ